MNWNRDAAAFLMHEDAMQRTCADVTAGRARLEHTAVRIFGACNHKLLSHLPEGTYFPLPPVTSAYDLSAERVDNEEFQVGPYRIRLGEVYSGA